MSAISTIFLASNPPSLERIFLSVKQRDLQLGIVDLQRITNRTELLIFFKIELNSHEHFCFASFTKQVNDGRYLLLKFYSNWLIAIQTCFKIQTVTLKQYSLVALIDFRAYH